MKTKGTVWVLGASSGLGLATANAFAKDGWLVVAGARSFSQEKKTEHKAEDTDNQGDFSGMLSEMSKRENVRLFPLDATSEESCERFVQDALSVSEQVDVLCYSAGLLILGACEETSPEEYERVMQTNFVGMVRMVGKALPLMRRQNRGKIILFSSLNGLIGIPFQSAYTASKHAIEGYAQCLAMESKPFGIQVSVVEPGDHQGGSQAYRLNAGEAGTASPYAAEYQSACQTIHRDESKGLLPAPLGAKVVRNANRAKMKYYLRVATPDQKLAVWLHKLLWPRLFFSVMRSYYVKKEKRSDGSV